MNKYKIIRSITAFILLMLFALSNTPKQWMHDLFANHVDCRKETPEADNAHSKIVKLKFHCQCDHLVVETPFTSAAEPAGVECPAAYSQYTASLYFYFTADHPLHYDLRGPPMV